MLRRWWRCAPSNVMTRMSPSSTAGGGLWLWNGHPTLAMVVGVSLGVTAIVATVMASLLPLGLLRLGADPALASGPVATVVQDIMSVGIYLMIATALLPV